jgi:hypothetical protein
LQLYFAARIGLMAVLTPQSTSFQRSEAWRLLVEKHRIDWHQEWVGDTRIAANLKRAVIASEDAGFVDHLGVEWDALEKAWEKNQRAEAAAARRNAQLGQRQGAASTTPKVEPKLVGGSTISQQLAKNLLLSGERTALREHLAPEIRVVVGERHHADAGRPLRIHTASTETCTPRRSVERIIASTTRMPCNASRAVSRRGPSPASQRPDGRRSVHLLPQ